ncbi:MAG: Uma2 family endonuclease [Chloroflexia bacterium]
MALPNELYTPEEYLALERQAQYKSEYLNGRIYPLHPKIRSITTPEEQAAHDTIATSLLHIITSAVANKPYQVFGAETALWIEEVGFRTHTDVMVIASECQLEHPNDHAIKNPLLILEIPTPASQAVNRGAKFVNYRKLTSLSEYILISIDEVHVEQYRRHNTFWVLNDLNELNDVIQLSSISSEIALSDIYHNVQFPQHRPEDNPETET